MIGFRIGNFTILQNKFIPDKTASGKLNYPGSPGLTADQPQTGLTISLTSGDASNTARTVLRGIPDEMVEGGEYSPEGTFKTNVQKLMDEFTDKGWKFAGRVLSNPTVNIVSIAGNVVTLQGAIGAVANVSSVRFLNAKVDGGASISGAYLVTGVAGLTVTLAGYTGGNMSVPSGKMRVDQVNVFDITDAEPSRICVRKVGRPFEGYRGRQSSRR